MNDHFIKPDWPASKKISAFTTLRTNGVSTGGYSSWNLANHVDDDKSSVYKNRELLQDRLALPNSPIWLQQVHGVKIFQPGSNESDVIPEADGSYTDLVDQVCCVLTADCLPVLITNKRGTEVAAVHAGWRGLAEGVVEAALDKFQSKRDDCLVWLGPAIGPDVFEVGEEVMDAFCKHDPQAAKAFKLSESNTLLADIYQLARQRLQLAGVSAVFGGGFCTFTEEDKFFSYRRNAITGRMASLIWIHA